MKRILLPILVIGVLLLAACGAPASTPSEENPSHMAILEFREQVTDANGQTIWVPAKGTINGQEKVLSSVYFKDTYVTTDDSGNILLVFEWTAEGSQLSEQITSRLIGKPLAIFEGDEPLLGEDGQPIVPTIKSVIKDKGQIEGLSLHEATTLSELLNASR